eukprot:15474990-Alexandrium_andersonii.AAC.1
MERSERIQVSPTVLFHASQTTHRCKGMLHCAGRPAAHHHSATLRSSADIFGRRPACGQAVGAW